MGGDCSSLTVVIGFRNACLLLDSVELPSFFITKNTHGEGEAEKRCSEPVLCVASDFFKIAFSCQGDELED